MFRIQGKAVAWGLGFRGKFYLEMKGYMFVRNLLKLQASQSLRDTFNKDI